MLVKVFLSAVGSLRLRTSATDKRDSVPGAGRRWHARSRPEIVEVIEVVEEQVHVLEVLLLALQVVDNALVFVHLYPDVRVSLPRLRSRGDEGRLLLVLTNHWLLGQVLVHWVLPTARASVGLLLLAPAERLVVKLAALLLNLVITNIESVAAEAVVAHPHLVAELPTHRVH